MTKKFPRMSSSDRLGKEAAEVLRRHIPAAWLKNEPTQGTDFGWDFLIDVVDEYTVTGTRIQIQVKGHSSPAYVQENRFVSEKIMVTTINYLRESDLDSLLCVCDLGDERAPIFWTFISDALPSNEKWQEQESVTLRIPIERTFDSDSLHDIVSAVRERRLRRRRNAHFGAEIRRDPDPAINASDSYELQEPIREETRKDSFLRELLVEQPDGGFIRRTPEDEWRHVKLRRAKESLERHQEAEVEQIVLELSSSIDAASAEIQAQYWVLRGDFEQRRHKFRDALSYTKRAVELQPHEPKYQLALLLREHFIARDEKRGVSDEFDARVDQVVARAPDEKIGVLLQFERRVEKGDWDAAIDGLKHSLHWSKQPITFRAILAEAFLNHGRLDEAEVILAEARKLESDVEKDALFWGLCGAVQHRMAMDLAREYVVIGYGSAQTNPDQLRQAEKYFEHAWELLQRSGVPFLGEPIVATYAHLVCLRGKPADAEAICKTFLTFHPDSISVTAALALAFAKQCKTTELVPAVKRVFDADPCGTHFKNYLIALNQAGELNDLLELVQRREQDGFRSEDERGFALGLSIVAARILGENEIYETRRKQLLELPGQAKELFLAELAIEEHEGTSVDIKRDRLRGGVRRFPDDLHLQSMLLQVIGVIGIENPAEVIGLAESIRDNRRLAPRQYLLFVTACMLANDLPRARKVLAEGVSHYPEYRPFLRTLAEIYETTGDYKNGEKSITRYLEAKPDDPHAWIVHARLLYQLGRIKDARRSTQRALEFADTDALKRDLHYQLYCLNLTIGQSARDILRNLHAFASLLEPEDADGEAQALADFLTCPKSLDIGDDEAKRWIADFQSRAKRFVEKYPNHPRFQMFSTRPDATPEEVLEQIRTELSKRIFPYEQQAEKIRRQAKEIPFPLSFRASTFGPSRSIFQMWDICRTTTDLAYAAFVFPANGDADSESNQVLQANEVVVDLSTLFTLAEFDERFGTLERFADQFALIFISWATWCAIQDAAFNPYFGSHPLARRLLDWRKWYESKIRIHMSRGLFGGSASEHGVENSRGANAGVETIADANQSIRLAQHLGVAYLCDEIFLRAMAHYRFGVKSFSSIGLFRVWRTLGRISLSAESEIYATMIKRNFVRIPVAPEHLNDRLDDLRHERTGIVTAADLRADPTFGSLVGRLIDVRFPREERDKLIVPWWLSLLQRESLSTDQVIECVFLVSNIVIEEKFAKTPILTAPNREQATESVLRFAGELWGALLWDTFSSHRKLSIAPVCALGVSRISSLMRSLRSLKRFLTSIFQTQSVGV